MSQSALGVGGDRRYSVPSKDLPGMHSEDLHAWSIYRQNLNSDFTDSALGSTDKSPLPYGNFQLRDTTVQSILSHPRYGPKSALGSNMYTYLKFGLPRVFPPNHNGSQRSGTPKPKTSIGSGMKPVPRIQRHSRGVRETSSGYDSSDNETSTNYKYSRKYRSDPDFRMNNLHPSYQPPNAVPVVAMQQAGIRGEPHWVNTRNKSVSEANLLGIEARPYRPQYTTNRRNSVAEFVPENDHQSYLMPSSHLGGRMSKAGSHMSLAQSRKHSTLRPGDQFDGYTHSAYIYPNYYVNNLEITTPGDKSTLLVSGLNFEVKSGEILAVLATSEHEATGLLDVLAGRKKKVSGDIIVNGQPVASCTLRKIAAYVRNDTSLCPAMTVHHTLQFHASLRRPRDNLSHVKMDSRDRINLLIEELGLEQVRDTNVGRLTRSEIRRLNVACQLLLDMAILILDQPTKEMDIFDTFFLVEYLRNWAGTGRVVIMSIHPPTYEIFAMLTKVVLMSAGRTMYSGYRRDMLPYFASIDYPCPAFKNPSDYYLDLVTLDSLSAAALLESSSRVSALGAALPRAPLPAPPPAPLPSPAVTRSPIPALLQKSLIYTQMHTLSNLIVRIILAAVMSIITGTIFWDLPTTDAKLTQNDRIGFHYSVMCLSVYPVLLWLTIREASSMRRYVERDIQAGLYSRPVFIIVDQFLDLWSSVIVWLAYLVPSYAMSGLYAQSLDDYNGFYLYLGYMLLYLISIQMMFRASIFIIPKQKTAAILSSTVAFLFALVSGVTLHSLDLPVWGSFRSLGSLGSPARWILAVLLRRELSETALAASIAPDMTCTKQNTYQDIIVQKTPCPPPSGSSVLLAYTFVRPAAPPPAPAVWDVTDEAPLVALATLYGVFAIVAFIGFVVDCTRYGRTKQRNLLKGHHVTLNTP